MLKAAGNTSPLQYLHQLGLLDLLPRLVGRVPVPEVVVDDIEAVRILGHDLPNVTSLAWDTVSTPASPYVTSPELTY